jgi:hypothetical protein
MEMRQISFGALRGAVIAACAAVALTLAAVAPAAAATPAADCQPYSGKPCLLPFPDNRLTQPDKASVTGLRINLPAAAMPVNTKGVRVSPAPYDGNDGFSPGSSIVVHIPGLDNAAALKRTGAVPLTDIGRSLAKRQPIVLIDQATGKRQLIWAELDSNAKGAASTDLLIHPAEGLTEGHTFIVALRDLRTAAGKLIPAPGWFARLRDGNSLPASEHAQRARYLQIFKALKRAKVATDSSLYEAWNFTVASRRGLTGRMLAIRNNAFAQLGDTNLGDSVVQGGAPAFTVTATVPETDSAGASLTEVEGTFQVPCYLIACGASAQPGFHYGSTGLYGAPTQIPGNVATTNFDCIVPATATAADPARISLYGHGLLGSAASEVTAGNVEDMAAEHNMVFCGTDFWGLAQSDTINDAGALSNLNLFPAVIDRLQQGALNSLFLGRLLLNPAGLASSQAFRPGGGAPDIETSNLYYDGNSQGGIMGGFLTALAPDWRHAVLGVTGIDYATLLVSRSTDFAPFGTILFQNYPDTSMSPAILDLMQQLWDRGDPDGYAQQMTSHPLPDTPSHQVLMQIAYGDHQVSMYSAAVEARTIGASAYQPALAADRSRDRNLFYGLPTIRSFPFSGSAIEVWDDGPGLVSAPPLGNVPPVTSNAPGGHDPHEDVRSSPLARVQKSDWLAPGGTIVNVCGGQPCRTSIYTP